MNRSDSWLNQIKADLERSQSKLVQIQADLECGHLHVDIPAQSRLNFLKSQEISRSNITIFTTAKPFVGHSRVIQRNALKSWTLLEPRPEIILFGDEQGAAQIANELGLHHIPNVKRNEHGTIFLSDMFEQTQKKSLNNIFVYINADIILTSDFVPAIEKVKAKFENFLMIGHRTDVDISVMMDLGISDWENHLRELVSRSGKMREDCYIDYFVFTRNLWPQIPDFLIGRVAWDKGLVYMALTSQKQIVDATKVNLAIHQNHDYSHVPGGIQEVWEGVEAQYNRSLIPAEALVYGLISYANWELTPECIQEKNPLVNACQPSPTAAGHQLKPVELADNAEPLSR